MYVSSLKKGFKTFPIKIAIIVFLLFILSLLASLRFIIIATPYAENKARYLATNTINTVTGEYLRSNEFLFTDIVKISKSENSVSYATVNSARLNIMKAELTRLINNAVSEENICTVNVPLANYLGIPFLQGIGTPLKIKMHPVSRVLIDFEKNFYSVGINQSHLSLNLKVTVTILVTMPGARRSVKVETDIPAGDAIFMGDVPHYFSTDGNFPPLISNK